MKTFLKSIIQKNQFNPGVLGIFLNPFFIARRGLFDELRKNSAYMKGKLLDVGCGEKPYEELFSVKEYIGLEYDNTENRENKKADVYYAGKKFPFKNGRFDSILCNQVLEHVFAPELFLKEFNRVLKKGGFVLLSVPFVWDEHEQPYDFGRYSSFGLKSLFERNGFRVVYQSKSVGGFCAILQLFNGWLFKKVSKNLFLKYFATISIMSITNILSLILLGLVGQRVSNSDFYLDNIIVAQKVSK